MGTLRLKLGFRFDSDALGLAKLFAGPRRGRVARALLGAVLGAMVAAGSHGMAMQASTPQDGMPPISQGAPSGHGNAASRADEQQDPMLHHTEQRMMERRNDERQKSLVVDTDKLLALAQQLKGEVDKSNKDQLSVDVYKRAEQIEKLAKSVKEKMRGY